VAKFPLHFQVAVRFYERFLKKAPKQSRSRTVVESVLSAASELLGRSADEEEVTIQAVAERAGVGVGSLYDYFNDRGSVFTSLAAKLTEDNTRRFEAELESCRGKPLDVTVRHIIDLLFDTYLTDTRTPRLVLRITHRANLMPLLAQNHGVFAHSMAKFLESRDDVDKTNLEIKSYVMTNMVLGVIHTLVWANEKPFPYDDLRAELARACHAVLVTPGH
jgi:AcrR family transcriptional regulator